MTRHVSILFYTGFAVILLGILSPLILHKLKPLEPLPRLGTAPAYSGIDSRGQEFATSELAGKPHIVTFFFSHCTTTCPQQNAALGRLGSEFSTTDSVHFVSITVDSENDTPEVLRQYSDKVGADPARWHFVRLDKPVLDSVLVDGFHLGSGGKPEYHSARLILVDASGEIRGYYDGTDAETPAKIAAHLRQLF